MNNSTVNFITPEASINSTTNYTGVIDSLNMCLFSISFIIGFPAHSHVLWLMVTGEERSVASAFFNINLSICEICSSLNFLFSVLKQIWFSHLTALTLFFIGLGVTGRPLFQCLICVERYLAVVHPVTFLKYKPFRYRLICCAVAWIIVLGFCLCGMYGLLEEDRYFYSWFFSIQFLLFLSLQLFCLVAVLKALKQSGPGERKREKEDNHMKRRAFHLILITTPPLLCLGVHLNGVTHLQPCLLKRGDIRRFENLLCTITQPF
ncbi:proteinase-activated receptor 3-like [Danio aesculapii]|uniref:proteinase-activated receptor 3-like n=1 Tax=Danio aesculapii TaxID=1142201 RepID=UPI0024BF3299|nr:proteinase-activated receptor 3-like [Danio aesculapii]